MIVDTSAIVAIFLKEPGYERLVSLLSEAREAGIGAPTAAETGLVLSLRLGRDPRPLLHRFFQEFGIVEIPFGEHHWGAAVDAYLRFGKGRHPAALNLGDCLSYAVAKLAGQPLLYQGSDFGQTDLESAQS
jgi:ribonuclease VapC